jgi:CubicO group peptidase (beta-lactamase class C family)
VAARGGGSARLDREEALVSFELLRERAEEIRARLEIPGVALGILHGAEEHVAGLGVTNAEHPLPVTPETLFQIGSISKTFLGTAVMRLAEQGQLDLAEPVRRYLPELHLSDEEAAARLTLLHLLTHTGGFQGDFFIDTGPGDDALARYVARMAELPQLTPPGELFSYCNAGFCLAGRVIEVVTGQPFEAALRELVLAPLGLERAAFFPADVMTHRFAVGHAPGAGGAEVLRPWPLARASNAAGGIAASVPELLRYARAHLPGEGDLLAAQSRAAMQAAQAPAGNFADAVGISWMLRDIGGVRTVRHGGATHGQMAELVLAPERGFALAILTNSRRGGELNAELAKWALAHFLGAADPEPRLRELRAGEISGFAGSYEAALTRVELRAEDRQLVAQVRPKGGFPTPETPAPPAPPPVRLAFTAEDRVVAQEPPFRDNRAEFVRDGAGRIAWLRWGGRLHRRVE